MKMKFTNLHHHENQIRLHQMFRTWIDGSTNPRWKLDRFGLLNFFTATQNATGYMQDQCYHLQANGAPITEGKVKRKMLRGIRTQILTLRSTSCTQLAQSNFFIIRCLQIFGRFLIRFHHKSRLLLSHSIIDLNWWGLKIKMLSISQS